MNNMMLTVSPIWSAFIYIHPYIRAWYPMWWIVGHDIFLSVCVRIGFAIILRYLYGQTHSSIYATNNGFYSIVILEQWIVHKNEDVILSDGLWFYFYCLFCLQSSLRSIFEWSPNPYCGTRKKFQKL